MIQTEPNIAVSCKLCTLVPLKNNFEIKHLKNGTQQFLHYKIVYLIPFLTAVVQGWPTEL